MSAKLAELADSDWGAQQIPAEEVSHASKTVTLSTYRFGQSVKFTGWPN
jgi:hypothetical protein